MIKFYLLIYLFLLYCTPFAENIPSKNSTMLSDEKVLYHINNLIQLLSKEGFKGIVNEPQNNRIYVDVLINNKPAKLFIDTGASFSFINKNCKNEYQLKQIEDITQDKILISTFLGGIISDFSYGIVDKFIIGNYKFTPWPFAIHESNIGNGILGVDFLYFCNAILICRVGALFLTIDHKPSNLIHDFLKHHKYQDINLIMRRSKKYRNIKWQVGEKEYELKSGVLVLDTKYNNYQGKVIIDTGSPFSSIHTEIARKINNRTKLFSNITISDAAGKAAFLSTQLIDSIKIGNYLLARDQYLAVIDHRNEKEDNIIGDELILGFLGFDLLVQNNAIIDFGNKKIYLQR